MKLAYPPSGVDLFILAGEPSADLHGEKLIQELLKKNPDLKIAAVSGPRMRKLPIKTVFDMENLQVMGFIDVLKALPKIIKHFFTIKKLILKENPKVALFIDYAEFNLRLEKGLKKKGFRGKLIHYISPSVWAWRKKRMFTMEKSLDLLLTILPFEKKCFENTSLKVAYVGHPLASSIPKPLEEKREKILALFPGSRLAEIKNNLPLQLEVARKLKKEDPSLKVAVSISDERKRSLIETLANGENLLYYPPEENYALMKKAHLALATSGTVILELALHETPTVVTFFIGAVDLFIARRLFKINLPYYSLPNLIREKEVFPELFGPNLTASALLSQARKLTYDDKAREKCIEECRMIRKILLTANASEKAAQIINSNLKELS